MENDPFFSEQRRDLTPLERTILERAFALLVKAESEGLGKSYVVDVAMFWPTGLHYRVFRAYEHARQRHWPSCFSSPWWLRDRPDLEDRSWDDSGRGLWSMLPMPLFRQVDRHGISPQQSFINVISDTLGFCDTLTALFKECIAEEWPNAPSLVFFIECSHWLVASQRFVSEQDARRWLSLALEVFNNTSFVGLLDDLDREQGFVRGEGVADEEPWDSDEQQYFHEGTYHDPLKEWFSGWLPDIGLPISTIRSVARSSSEAVNLRGETLHGCGGPLIQDADRAALWAVTSLRDRGYIHPRGFSESPDTRWAFPADCVLTGAGYVRAKALFGE